MDFVIPVALGELLAKMDILTAAKLNRQRAKALAPPKLQCLDSSQGVRIDVFDWVQRGDFQKMLMVLLAGEAGGVAMVAGLGWRE